MPTFDALGIAARLSVSSLQSTLTQTINLRQGQEQQNEFHRMKTVQGKGRSLVERDFEQSVRGNDVLDGIGEKKDMAFCIVGVGDALNAENCVHVKGNLLADGAGHEDNATLPVKIEGDNISVPHRANKDKRTRLPAQCDVAKNTNAGEIFSEKNGILPDLKQADIKNEGLSALTLVVDFTAQSFPRNQQGARQDLKIEVFLNGQLSDVAFVASRRAIGQTPKFARDEHFGGTRFHRQHEKPWTYQHSTADNAFSSEKRWIKTKENILNEVEKRGKNLACDRPISAKFLLALSKHFMPASLIADGSNMAIIDIVITAGHGRKHGANTAYIKEPTRLIDAEFSEHNSGMPLMAHGDLVTPDSMSIIVNGGNTPFQAPTPNSLTAAYHDILPMSHHGPRSHASTKTKRKFNLPDTVLNKRINRYRNAHRQAGKGRTLKQRLADLGKMSPKKRAKAWSELQDELDPATSRAIRKYVSYASDLGSPTPGACNIETPLAEVRTNVPSTDSPHPWFNDFEAYMRNAITEDTPAPAFSAHALLAPVFSGSGFPPLNMSTCDFASPRIYYGCVDPALGGSQDTISSNGNGHCDSIDPRELLLSPEHVSLSAATTFPLNAAQDRNPNGVDRGSELINMTPDDTPTTNALHKRPFKKTKATAFARSPTSQLVKFKLQKDLEPVTPTNKRLKTGAASFSRSGHGLDSENMALSHCSTPINIDNTAVQSGLGAKRTAHRWNPEEATPDEALKDFVTPELCKGSVVTYAGSDMQRQVPKARGGSFKEEEFVVGMRLIVL